MYRRSSTINQNQPTLPIISSWNSSDFLFICDYYFHVICVKSTGIIITVCSGSCRHREAKINPQDTRSALRFRMADKQQHLVTFWCSYGGFNPLLSAAPRWWLQQTGAWCALELLSAGNHTGRPCKDDDIACGGPLIHRTVRDPESDCVFGLSSAVTDSL